MSCEIISREQYSQDSTYWIKYQSSIQNIHLQNIQHLLGQGRIWQAWVTSHTLKKPARTPRLSIWSWNTPNFTKILRERETYKWKYYLPVYSVELMMILLLFLGAVLFLEIAVWFFLQSPVLQKTCQKDCHPKQEHLSWSFYLSF